MAERKSGPVKPPVIDLKAREAGDDTSDSPRMPPPRPPAVLAMPWNAIGLAAGGGAVLGCMLTYLMANVVAFPDKRPQIADPAPTLAQQAASLSELGTRLAAVEEQAKRTQAGLDTTVTQLAQGLTELRASIAALPKPADPVDMTPLSDRLTSLEAKVDAIGAGASPADASALAATIDKLKSELDSVAVRFAALDQRLGAQDAAIAATRTDIDATKTAIATQNRTLGGADIAPAVRLPLVVTGLESAFGSGRAYATELRSLTALLPDLVVPKSIIDGAAGGLPRPDAVAERFTAQIPVILAGRTATSSGDIGQDAVDWMKALLAFRPAGEREGDTPDAVMSRLEAAVGRHEFQDAAAELSRLPEPMQIAAGDVGADIRTLAEADQFISTVRAAALQPAAEGTP